jgi:sec-independent protein translocase protein TatA
MFGAELYFIIFQAYYYRSFPVFGVGPWELVVILVIVLIVFGVGKLPELGSGLGEGIKNFRKAYRDAKALDVTTGSEGKAQDSSEKKEENN